MTRYLLPRLAGAALVGFLAIYFVYREVDDRWLTGKLVPWIDARELEPASVTPAPGPGPAPRPVAPEILHREPAPELELERRLLETHATLARALERRLVDQLESVHHQYADQSERMAQTRRIVERISERTRIENLAVAAELGNSIQAMESELLQLDHATDDLDAALDAWSRTYRSLKEMGEISGDFMDERNYRIETYRVSGAETLTDILRKVEREHGVPGTDLRTLVGMFNNIETRLRAGVGRRGPQRVVTNAELLIPIPRGTAGMIAQAGVPVDLEAQRDAIERARQRQTDLDQSLRQRIDQMREFVARLDQLDQLARDLQESLTALESHDLRFIEETATVEQREAWTRFNRAFDAYTRVESGELKNTAASELEAATEGLIEAYTSRSAVSLEDADRSSSDDLDWFRGFLERYEPASLEFP